MLGFSLSHLISALLSEALPGRWAEVGFWLRSVGFAGGFMINMLFSPRLGYLPATVLFADALTLRHGYRGARFVGAAAFFGVAVVVVSKSLLQVKVPGGARYEHLPTAMRSFMLTYF